MSARLRIVVGSVGLAGHSLPALALAGELRRRGHAVLFHGWERWRAPAERLGLAFEGGERQIAEPAAADAPLAVVARALAESLERFEADVVVGDGLTLAPVLAAELRGLPRAILFPEVYPDHAPGMPFFSLGLRAPRTTVGRAGWRLAEPLVGTRLPSRGWLRESRRSLNAERAALGLPPVAGYGPIPPGATTLVATLPQLEYPRSWPAGVHVTGPLSIEAEARHTDLPGGDLPLVVIAPSTVKDPKGRLIDRAFEALADEPVQLLVSTGGVAGRAAGLPAGVAVADWIDFDRVLPEAALVICHGNHGTLTAALANGAPVLACPAMDDDAEHGARLTWAGAGLMIPRPLLGARSVRAVVRTMLAEPAFTRRAGEIAAWSRRHPGDRAAANVVERLAVQTSGGGGR